MANCGHVAVTGAEGLVEQKWMLVENISTSAVQAAKDAIGALTGTTGDGITNAGRALEGVNFDTGAGSTDVNYESPEQPEVPELAYEDSPAPASKPIASFSTSGVSGNTPTFTGAAPSVGSVSPFALEPMPSFSGQFTPPATPAYNTPSAPGDFNDDFEAPTVTVNPLTPPAVFSGTLPTPSVKPPTPVAPDNALTKPPDIDRPNYPGSFNVQMPTQPAEVGIPLPTLRIPDLSGIDALLRELRSGQPTPPEMTIPDDNYLDTFNQLRRTLGPELEPVLPIEEVLTWMLSGTSIGIPANVAMMLRDRAFAAEDKLAFQAETTAMGEWLSRGFTLPGGALEAQLSAVRQQNRDKKAQLNRDLWLEEAKLEIEALREAIKMGIQYQSALWDAKTKLWSLCGDLANRFMDVQIKVLEITLSAYKAQLDAWQAEANVVKEYIAAKLQVELGKLEVTKVEAQVSGLFVQINGQHVELYKAQMEGVMAEVNIYKARIDAANGQMQAETLKLEAYAKQVAAYSAAVQAYEAEWRGYTAAVQADSAQVEAFKATVQAYGAQVDAYGKGVEAERSRVTAEVEVAKLGLEKYKAKASVYTANVDAYSKQVEAEKSRVLAEVEIAKLPLEAYKAQAQAYSAQADAFGKRAQAEASRVQGEVEIAKLPVEAYKAQAQAYAAQVEGYGKAVDAERIKATTHVEIEKLKLEEFRNGLEAYKAELQRSSIELESKARVHGAQVQLFGTLVESEKARVNADLQNVDQKLRQTQFETSIELKKAELEQTKVIEMAKLALQADSEVGRIASQLAASALSATNATAQISNSFSTSRDSRCSENYNYDMSEA